MADEASADVNRSEWANIRPLHPLCEQRYRHEPIVQMIHIAKTGGLSIFQDLCRRSGVYSRFDLAIKYIKMRVGHALKFSEMWGNSRCASTHLQLHSQYL